MTDQHQLELAVHRLQLQEYYRHIQGAIDKQYQHSQTYTVVIVFGAFGALLTIWWGTKDFIDPGFVGLSAAFIGLSVVSFVAHEFYNVWFTGNTAIKNAGIVSNTDIDQGVKDFFEAQRRTLSIAKKYSIWWQISFLISVFFGVSALLIIISGLIDFAGWQFWTISWWKAVVAQ